MGLSLLIIALVILDLVILVETIKKSKIRHTWWLSLGVIGVCASLGLAWGAERDYLIVGLGFLALVVPPVRLTMLFGEAFKTKDWQLCCKPFAILLCAASVLCLLLLSLLVVGILVPD